MEDLEYDLVTANADLADETKTNAEWEAKYADLEARYQMLLEQMENPPPHQVYDVIPVGGLQALLDLKGEGGIVNLPPDTYRLTKPLVPHKGQIIMGNGSTFKGSVTVGTWEKEGSLYFAKVALPDEPYVDSGVCEIITGPDANGCRVLEDVFNGGKKLTRVMQKTNLAAGKVWTDYATKRVYIADVPDNVEVALTRFFINSDVDGVRVTSMTVSQFASPSQQGALTISGEDWEVDNCLFTQNHSSGLHVTTADRVHVHHNTMEYNGQAGMTHHKTMDSLIEYNAFRGNNTNDYYRRDWESAGLKITYSQHVIVQFNKAEANWGIGIWCDIDNKDIHIFDNLINDNFSCGIRYEISFDGEIKRNTIAGNGFGHAGPGRGSDYSGFATAGIHVNGAGGMDNGILLIEGNTLGKNQNGIHIEERNRGKSQTYPAYNWTTRNVHVINNQVDLTQSVQGYGTGVVGLGQLGTVVSDVYKAGNIFEGNKYLTPNISKTQFHVKDTAVNQYRTFARWQELGYDKLGSITVV
jgi:hypothetical protein